MSKQLHKSTSTGQPSVHVACSSSRAPRTEENGWDQTNPFFTFQLCERWDGREVDERIGVIEIASGQGDPKWNHEMIAPIFPAHRVAHPPSRLFRLPWPHAEPGSDPESPLTTPAPAIHRPSSLENPVPKLVPSQSRTAFGSPNYIRISIGLEEENYKFIEAMKETIWLI